MAELTQVPSVVLDLARNCTDISPCQQDTAIIRDAEIEANVVNQCGRTELAGNIDVGENTENQLAAGQVADVVAGDTVTVTIHQVNADGAGPYTCDLDETSELQEWPLRRTNPWLTDQGNTGVFTRTNLPIKNNVPGKNGLSQAKEQNFNMQVSLPKDLNCTGASAGNICMPILLAALTASLHLLISCPGTLRCRNNALAGPFGGCVALQQTDSGAGRKSADPSSITTSNTLDEVQAQVEINKGDLNKAIAANEVAGSSEADKGVAAADGEFQWFALDDYHTRCLSTKALSRSSLSASTGISSDEVLADILLLHVALISGAGINTAVSDPTSIPAPRATGRRNKMLRRRVLTG
jgi:hypothetical protein